MRQEVNLLRLEDHEDMQPLAANTIAAGTAMLVGLLFIITLVLLFQQSSLQDSIEQAKSESLIISSRLEKLKATRPLSQRPQLLANIQMLEKQVRRREQLRNIIGAQDLGNFAGFSEYLSALAAQADVDIALTDIRILDAGKLLELEGWTRKPSVVPGYLYLLRSEDVFKPVKFGTLSIERETERSNKVYFMLGKVDEDES